MNSYNDNLHSTVVGSLADQELEIKTVHSQAIASMFTLFHAEAATITAQETLTTDTETLDQKKEVNDQAVINTNISTNLLASATQADTYVKQSTTNTAVCASNVQIASNAIVQLAGDMGSIYSIVHAADYQSDIYALTEEARTLINHTAYLAEVASDMAMEASILTSEVSSGTVLSKAKLANTSLTNLYATTTNDFNNASQLVAADTLNVGAVSVTEQAAEGAFEDIAMDYRSTFAAYRSTQRELNLNLRVLPIVPTPENEADYDQDTLDSTRKVKFNLLRSPFPKYSSVNGAVSVPGAKHPSALRPAQPSLDDWTFYPVQHYYFILAKDSKKSTFTIANAETIVRDNPERVIKVPEELIELGEDLLKLEEKAQKRSPKSSGKSGKGSSSEEIIIEHNDCIYYIRPRSINVDINFLKVNGGNLRDCDGDPVAFGTDYVIFVMATFEESYKKQINNFDEYLSAPSFRFTLRHQLIGVNGETIDVTLGTGDNPENKVSFKVKQRPNVPVEYRCMFLPYGDGLPTGLLNQLSFEALMKEVNEVERISNQYEPMIAKAELDIALMSAQKLTATSGEAKELAAKIEQVQKQLAQLMEAYNKAMDNAVLLNVIAPGSGAEDGKNTIDFLFNLTIAEQVSPGSYVSILSPTSPSVSDIAQGQLSATFGADVTDIFGNLLDTTRIQYLPVVLSMYNGEEQNIPAYSNAWSGYENSTAFPVPTPATANNSSKKK